MLIAKHASHILSTFHKVHHRKVEVVCGQSDSPYTLASMEGRRSPNAFKHMPFGNPLWSHIKPHTTQI